ncbi:protein of unknown function [Mucilaginibacter gossypiicola]|uniref:DUF4385 domain-containing protein n=1 Tax=Mucilaginibacter gossypiicola TaxID=551995 RepID=A0A1H8KTP2_9SPHI|nr:DUF4385 domain-containing protein [Mucilaginibacter gossypiicola]SEN96249.1 protein of unknown function [Mucilaginibacter gossypiicola]
MQQPSYLNFDAAKYAWKSDIDYKKYPERYSVGKGEQGVLICEPYKSEIGKYWRFKTKSIAEESSQKIYDLFNEYLAAGDFVGADMARKYLQMRYTRARRYTNYRGGRKYDAAQGHVSLERGAGDPEKADAAKVFYARWKAAEANEVYAAMKKDWKHARA